MRMKWSRLSMFLLSMFCGMLITVFAFHFIVSSSDRVDGMDHRTRKDNIIPVDDESDMTRCPPCTCYDNGSNHDKHKSSTNSEAMTTSLTGVIDNKPHLSPYPTSSSELPTIFIITPTYKRQTQKVDLVRLCQTLMLVSNITWIIVEDSSSPSNIVSKILAGCPVSSVHLHVKTTTFVSRKKGGGGHRGVEQRNEGLKWIRGNCRKMGVTKGVVYFGDDDNGYDYRLFEEMRYTKIISVWPVAFVGMLNYEGPKCKNGKVVDFHTVFRSDRRFPFDMAAFAVNLDVIMAHPKVYINHKSPAGMLENDFLTSLGLSRSMLEPKANDCKEIYVWHIKTEKPRMVYGKTHKGDPDIEANI